jgi:hypothetical protein
VRDQEVQQRKRERRLSSAVKNVSIIDVKTQKLVREVDAALGSGVLPVRCQEGSGGAYVLSNPNHQPLAVFKPRNEEPNNQEEGICRSGVQPGEGAIREVAVYFLDSRSKALCAGVPPTALVECPKWSTSSLNRSLSSSSTEGSLQLYMSNEGGSWDFSPSQFSVNDVHRIGILDVRVMNTDRHGGNILVSRQKTGVRLIPIDHAFCLPESFGDFFWFEWANWPQAKIPFSQQLLNAIQEINIEHDASLLRQFGLSEKAIHTLRIGTLLLQKTAPYLTLCEIGNIASKKTPNDVSLLEQLCEKALEMTENTTLDFFEVLAQLFDTEILASRQIIP